MDSELCQKIIRFYLDTGSVKGAARFAGVSEVKARRILLTEGLWSSDKIKAVGEDVIRLHLELIRSDYDPVSEDDGHLGDSDPGYDFSEEELRVLRDYGGVTYGKTFSRDLLVPGSLPLYALHYVIQAAFGWENSHLHRFNLPPKCFRSVTNGRVGYWSRLVGVLLRSP